MKFISIAFLLLFSINASAENYKCDVDAKLKTTEITAMTVKDAKAFKANYDEMYGKQEAAIKKSASRTKYFETAQGKATLAALEKARTAFSYDMISAYLFDSTELNSNVEFYNGLVKSGAKTYYLSGARVIAKLEQRKDENNVLTRFDENCRPKEIISFKTLSAMTDDPISFKINAKSCHESIGGLRDLSEAKQSATESFFSKPDEKQDARQWKNEIMGHCARSFSVARTGVDKKQTVEIVK